LSSRKSLVEKMNPEIRDFLLEMGADGIYKCYRCGKCTSACPWFQVGTYDFPVFRFSLEAALGMIASSEDKDELAREVETIYHCVGCEACVDQCPHGINTPDILRASRRILVDFGSYPEALKSIVRRIHDVGNPLGEPREKDSDWADDLDLPDYAADLEFLYFSCCISSFDQRVKSVARATARILKEGGVSFGILRSKGSCCGEAVRRVGAESVFQETAARNFSAFQGADVHKVLVNSPHCLTSFRKDYPELGADLEVVHTSQCFSELIESGKVTPKKAYEKKVVYHDPCALGRQNEVYEEPRSVLMSIPGLELLEVEDFNRRLSLCCGAGSGGLWTEWEKDERIADVRIRQLVDTGADIIGVACPYCLQMLEETAKSMNLEIPVMDIAEILVESCVPE
jgi:Fe-S oxidoreductase